MALVKTMNATIVTGEYVNQNGETKKSYMTIGTLFIYDDGGISLKLDAMPIGTQNISFYEKHKKEQNEQQQGYPQQQAYPQQQQAYPQQQGYPQQQAHPQQAHQQHGYQQKGLPNR